MSIPKQFRSWVWAFFWSCIIFLVGSCLYFGQGYWRSEIVRIYVEGLHFSTEEKPPDILILGDSLVRWSFPHAVNWQGAYGFNISWASAWVPGGSYLDFNSISSVLSEGGSVVLINQDVLFRDNLWGRRKTFRIFLGFLVRTIKYGSIEKAVENQQMEKVFCKPGVKYSDNNILVNQKKTYTRKEILSPESIDFLRVLNDKADKVLVMRLARSRSFEKSLEPYLNNFQVSLEKLLDDEGIELVELGPPMPDDYYCDGRHPNEIGRKVRTQQLLNLVKERFPSIQ